MLCHLCREIRGPSYLHMVRRPSFLTRSSVYCTLARVRVQTANSHNLQYSALFASSRSLRLKKHVTPAFVANVSYTRMASLQNNWSPNPMALHKHLLVSVQAPLLDELFWAAVGARRDIRGCSVYCKGARCTAHKLLYVKARAARRCYFGNFPNF